MTFVIIDYFAILVSTLEWQSPLLYVKIGYSRDVLRLTHSLDKIVLLIRVIGSKDLKLRTKLFHIQELKLNKIGKFNFDN